MYIYAETAFHHEGDMNFLLELIDAIAETDCNGVKFQVLSKTEDFVSERHGSFEALKSYCFDFKEWETIFEYTAEKGLDIILMPLNIEATLLAKKDAVKLLDIHSVSFNDTQLMRAIKETHKNIILGIGGRTQEEINGLISYFENKIKVLMVGFQAFPSKLEDVGMGKIQGLKSKYPNLEIGYADHSEFSNDYAIRSNEYARIFGATVFEKHVTLREGKERIDAISAISVVKLKEVISRLNFIENHILPEPPVDHFNEAEQKYRNRQAVVVARRNIPENTILTDEDLALKLFDGKADYTKFEDLVGRKLITDLAKDYPLTTENIA